MTLCEILTYIRFVSNKPQRGNAFSPTEFNLSLLNANSSVFNDELTKFTPGGAIPESLRRFLMPIAAGTLATGVYTLPSDFAELATMTFSCTIGGSTKYGKFVSDTLASRMLTSVAYRLDKNPIAVMRSGTIQVYPTNATAINFQYLKQPATPVYDYYIDAGLQEVCLALGGAHTLAGSEVGSLGQVAPTVVTSLTVELDWDEEIHPRIVSYILRDLGVNIREQDVAQFGELRKQEAR